MNEFLARIGTFFFILGFGMFVLFLASDMADMPQFDYLCLAMVAAGLGWILQRRRSPPPSAGRFSLLRKTRERMRRKRGEPGEPGEQKPAGQDHSEDI